MPYAANQITGVLMDDLDQIRFPSDWCRGGRNEILTIRLSWKMFCGGLDHLMVFVIMEKPLIRRYALRIILILASILVSSKLIESPVAVTCCANEGVLLFFSTAFMFSFRTLLVLLVWPIRVILLLLHGISYTLWLSWLILPFRPGNMAPIFIAGIYVVEIVPM